MQQVMVLCPSSAALVAVALICQPVPLPDTKSSPRVHRVPRKAGGAAPEELGIPGEGRQGGLGQEGSSSRCSAHTHSNILVGQMLHPSDGACAVPKHPLHQQKPWAELLQPPR